MLLIPAINKNTPLHLAMWRGKIVIVEMTNRTIQQRQCSVEGCDNPLRYKARKLCGKHYKRWNKHGDPLMIKDQKIYKAEEHVNWKGGDATYEAIHQWVGLNYGKPKLCEHCKTTYALVFDWANISGTHKRIRSDWIRLCRKCHMKMDGRKNSVPPNRKDATSKYKGVSRNGKNWSARSAHDGKIVNIGTFPTQEKAANAYDEYEQKHFGDNAYLNFRQCFL